MRRLLLAGVFAGLSSLAVAAELPRATPASIGLDPHQLDAITAQINQDVAGHVIPGAVLMILRHGKVGYEHVFGSRDPQVPSTQAGGTAGAMKATTSSASTR